MCQQAQHKIRDHHIESPRAKPESGPALSLEMSQQVVQKQEEKEQRRDVVDALRVLVLEVDSSSSSLSQRRDIKAVKIYSALWPRNASNGSITLHHDQYAATVSFKAASTTERKPNIQNPAG